MPLIQKIIWKKIKDEITMKINFEDMQVTEKQPPRYKVCTNVGSKTGSKVLQKTLTQSNSVE